MKEKWSDCKSEHCGLFTVTRVVLMKSFSRIKANLPTLRNHRLQDIAILMDKVKNDLVPMYILDLFIRNTSNYNLRNKDDFSSPRFNTITYGRHSLRYIGPFIWSKLHKSIKMAKSLNAFKAK